MNKKLLIIFCKNPELGKVKTRIAKTLGDEKALAIYYKLINYTQQVTEKISVDKLVCYSDFIDREDNWSNTIFKKYLQKGANLGERMLNAFQHAFDSGYSSVCIIGTDCIEITDQIINDAFAILTKNDVVLGPAIDGGYYLLGMNKLYPFLFQKKKWSSDSVAKDTLQDFITHKLSYGLLAELSDIDEAEDVKGWFN